MDCRVVLPSPAERFRGRAAFRTRGGIAASRRSGRPSTACCAPEGEGMPDAAFPSLRAFSCPVAEGRAAWARAGETPGRKCSLCRCASARRVKEKSLFKAHPPRSAAARVRCGSLFRMRQAGFRRLRGKRPGALRQSSSSLSGRSINSRTAAAGSAFS